MPSAIDPVDSSRPLADYFWISGLDTQQLDEAFCQPQRWSHDLVEPNGLDSIIKEDVVAENDQSSILQSPRASINHARHDSFQRLSELSDEARDSISSIDSVARPQSSRSSLTIRAAAPPTDPRMSSLISEADFDKAMQKFATNRDEFYLDLTFQPSEKSKPARSKSRPKTQRIVAQDEPSPLLPNRNFGSIRRHLSFKDMSSAKRQPSMARRMSTRTSRRLSSYNSVIPSPETFHSSPDQHPLTRKFEPVLLERFPRSVPGEKMHRRVAFPDYVPMFASPNDIKVISADTRPRSTWHEFSMTAGDNSRITAVSVTIWIPVHRDIATALDKKCEEWRKAHMSEAERELATSLAERLAMESTKLSRLLTQLPQASQDSQEREALEEEIGAVEEKISVMSDMLRPLRHTSESDIQGLAGGETRYWIPRTYGISGKDSTMANFWRQWLRAVIVPMTDGGVLRVPASSPKVGTWQPLERYVATLCLEAPCPMSSKIQVQTSIRELQLYAKTEAANELPGSRTTDLYPLFRTLTIPNIILLFEYALAESRIILLSSHIAMLQLVSKAILQLIWPLEWTGVYIPVLPSRLVQALDAPCPYICGIDRKYEKYDLPDEDYVLVDLDKNELHSTDPPPLLPKQQRRKLMALLYQAAPLHQNFGVTPGPPSYATETYPHNAFSAELESTFTAVTKSTNLDKLAGLSSTAFGPNAAMDTIRRAPIVNAFLASSPTRGKSADRPVTSSPRKSTTTDSDSASPVNGSFGSPGAWGPGWTDSPPMLQTSLREKKSGHFDSLSKRSFSGSTQMLRKASIPFVKHNASPSTSTTLSVPRTGSSYAPSTYAQSTLAASTIMPGMMSASAVGANGAQGGTRWCEGHCLQWRASDGPSTCIICDEKATDGYYRCQGCGLVSHDRCVEGVSIVCSAAFYPDQIRAAFARCMASLFYTYRKFMTPAPPPTPAQKKKKLANPKIFTFDHDSFVKSLAPDHAVYIEMLAQTQAWNEFIMDREEKKPSPATPSIALFDAIINAKRSRAGLLRSGALSSLTSGLNRRSFSPRHAPSLNGSGGAGGDLLADTSQHQWRIVSVPSSNERAEIGSSAMKGRDYHSIITRTPAKLEEGLFKQEEKVPDLPSVLPSKKAARMSSVLADKLNGLGMHAP